MEVGELFSTTTGDLDINETKPKQTASPKPKETTSQRADRLTGQGRRLVRRKKLPTMKEKYPKLAKMFDILAKLGGAVGKGIK